MMLFLRALVFTIYMPGSVTVWIPWLLLSVEPRPLPWEIGGLRSLGIVFIVLGATGYLWCAWDFMAAGRGTPAPWDAPRQFVARGLYRFTRNPMYVSVALVLLGEVLLFASLTLLVFALVVLVCFHLFVLFYEEPTLRQRFGAAYEAYCRSVPRWLVKWS